MTGDGVRRLIEVALSFAFTWYTVRQCRKPAGWLGRLIVGGMNRSHSALTAWGLQHTAILDTYTVLDVGCGGGQTIRRLAAMASSGKVHGVDYSETSVAASRALNKAEIESGRVDVQVAGVSHLPFADNTFDLVTAVETHYYWPDRLGDLREVRRVLKPGGSVLIIAEAFRGRKFDLPYRLSMKLLSGAYLTADEHKQLLADAGYVDSNIFVEHSKGWICATARKPPN